MGNEEKYSGENHPVYNPAIPYTTDQEPVRFVHGRMLPKTRVIIEEGEETSLKKVYSS
ncbi:MAG: hypothetical protein KKF68_01115 [Nanoarchaeota archaeon]|nr:hypothetical protein [Nanoarchaeota archaeon]